jgi:protein involved in polysaccharide export with SLBB domain
MKAEAKKLMARAAAETNESKQEDEFRRARQIDGEADAKLLEAEAHVLRNRVRLIDQRIESAELATRAETSSEPKRLKANDILQIRVEGTPEKEPINGLFRLETSGTVPLGPRYGRIQLAGLTIEEAEDRLKVEMSKVLRAPVVWVTEGDFPQGQPASDLTLIETFMKELQQLRSEVSELRNRP